MIRIGRTGTKSVSTTAGDTLNRVRIEAPPMVTGHAPSSDDVDALIVGLEDLRTSIADDARAPAWLSVRPSGPVDAITEDAVDAIIEDAPHVVVSSYDLGSGTATGLTLLRAIRDRSEEIPFVLCSAAADETVASEAVSAGVDEYVVGNRSDERGSGAFDVEEVVAAIERAVERGRARRDRERFARGFEAVFHDDRSATLMLDASGTVRRANRAALELRVPHSVIRLRAVQVDASKPRDLLPVARNAFTSDVARADCVFGAWRNWRDNSLRAADAFLVNRDPP